MSHYAVRKPRPKTAKPTRSGLSKLAREILARIAKRKTGKR